MNNKILIIDDDKELLLILGTILSRKGYQVEKTGGYHEGLQKARSKRFDLIYIDAQLGDGNGLQLAATIKAENNPAYVIIMTLDSSFATAHAALQERTFDFISKPITPDALILTTLNALGHKSIRDKKETLRKNLETIFVSVECGIVILDAKLKITMVTPQIQHSCGFNIHDKQLTYPTERLYCSMVCRKTVETSLLSKQKVRKNLIDCRKTSNRNQLIEISVSPICNEKHELIQIAIVYEVVTNDMRLRTKLRESGTSFRQWAENQQDVFWIFCMSSQKVLFVNSAYEKIWGYPFKALYDNPMAWVEAVYPDDQAIVVSLLNELETKGTWDKIFRIIRTDGEIRWIWSRGFPVKDDSGQVVRAASIAQDITINQLAQNRFKQSQEDLESLIKIRTRELSESQEQLFRVQKLKSIGTLAGAVAHDFNNILMAIMTNAHLLSYIIGEDQNALAFVERSRIPRIEENL